MGFLHEFINVLIAIVIYFILIIVLGLGHIISRQFPLEALNHIFSFLLIYLVTIIVRVYGIRKEIGLLLDHQKGLDHRIRRTVLSFLLPRLRVHLESTRTIANDEGMEIIKNDLESLVASSFAACKGSYQGTDSSPPSVFNMLYPTYIYLQSKRKSKHKKGDTRFLIVSQDQLISDFNNNQKIFKDFYDLNWLHNGIPLLQVDPDIAEEKSRIYRLPSTDLGVFSWRFVIFYKPRVDDKENIRYLIHIRSLTKNLIAQVALFLNELNKNSSNISLEGGRLSFPPRSEEEVEEQAKRMFISKYLPRDIKRSQL
jgi:hypothetical protein